MNDQPKDTERKELLKRALLKIEELEARLKSKKPHDTDPVAVIGIGCRFPGGADSPESFWQLLQNGVDAVGEIPSDRWEVDAYFDPNPEASGKMYTRNGAFLDQVDRFDPLFFGITPREAMKMDPQQRILLEVVWEALEHAGQAPEELAGTITGVYIGMNADDYAHLHNHVSDRHFMDLYYGSGVARSIAAGRISYTLGLRGPSIALDTACSSSLVAVHLACQSLRTGECRMALAGGVTLILSPDGHIVASKGNMLSTDGRCKTFDASADGYGRGEGCGIVVLKRFSDALADGDNILAIIRGTAANQDGKSGGLTAPSGIAQEQVIRKALEDGGMNPLEVSYIETHGTGTVLGDPIEVQALGNVYGINRLKDQPLFIGSVKTNIGHLEAAAGIAGLIKAVLSIDHGEIPPHLHLRQPNPHIAWDQLPITINTERCDWPSYAKRRIVGVSSFGFSGTNVHVILEGMVPQANEMKADARSLHLFAISSKTARALDELAQHYVRYFDQEPSDLIKDVCYTANTGRSHFHCRLAVIGKTAKDMSQGLRSFREGLPVASVIHGEVSSKIAPPVAFLFTGQGSQAVGMGQMLYKSQPIFRETLERCQEVLRNYLSRPLLDVIYPASGKEQEAQDVLDQTGFTQPALFSMEYALAELWKSWGVEPSVVMGHSVGEYVAACVAGVFSLEDGLRLIAERARFMQNLAPGGGMAAVFADATRVTAAIGAFAGTVSIAAFNNPANTVISGPQGDLRTILDRLKADGIGSQELRVSHAFHSHLMEPMLADFERVAATVQYAEPQIDIVSNVSGKLIQRDDLASSAYWCRHVRKPVQFMASMQTLYNQGYRLFLEVGPHPTLLGMGHQCLDKPDCIWVPTLRRGHDDWEQMLKSLGSLYVNGVHINWRGFEQKVVHRRVPLPTYPFQRERHWVDAPKGNSPPLAHWDSRCHPLLGRRAGFAKSRDIVFESVFDIDRITFMKDHRFYNTVIVPATAYLEMGHAAAVAIAGPGHHVIEDFDIHAPLVIDEGAHPTVQTVVTEVCENEALFEIYGCTEDNLTMRNEWKLHANGKLNLNRKDEEQPDGKTWPIFQQQVQARCDRALNSVEYYKMLSSRGVDYGPAFNGLEDIRRGNGEAIGRIRVPDILKGECQSYHMHPALLDVCLQLLGVALLGDDDLDIGGDVYMPMGLEQYYSDLHAMGDGWIHSMIRSGYNKDRETFVGDIRVFNNDGRVMVHFKGLRFKRTTGETLRCIRQDYISRWLYELQWLDLGPLGRVKDAYPSSGKWLIFSDRHGIGKGLADHLQNVGQVCTLVHLNGAPYGRSNGAFTIAPDCREDIDRLFGDIAATGHMAIDGIVYLQGIDVRVPDPGEPDWEDRADLGCIGVLNLIQAMAVASWTNPPHLTLVTQGAATVDNQVDALQPGQAALWGLGRVIANEHPEFQCKLVDLDPETSIDERIRSLASEILHCDGRENQIALRQGCRRALRLVRGHFSNQSNTVRPGNNQNKSFQLEISTRGVLDNLELKPATTAPPGPGEVQIQVEATGLNFRDVLNALGMYPGEPGALGNECVGRIAMIGEGIGNFAVGDPVLALTPRAFCTFVNVNAELAVSRPAELSVEEAATIPMTFLTAYYALHHLGSMSAGERVLIHAGAGGVGMAAIQMAQQAGAEIFATAGSEEKRTLLRTLGVRHVTDSRSLAFADQVMEATAGKGIDIVLNSLAGDFIPKSLSLLREGGRFLELGKTDLWNQARAWQINPDATFLPVFLGDICRQEPTLVQSMFQHIMEGLREGRLKPLPRHLFHIHDIAAAFRFMAQARHIGKVVVDHRDSKPDQLIIHDNASYLITGGLGALGLHFTGWLVEKGARHLVLVGRKAAGAVAQEAIDRLKASGVEIVVARGDVCKKDDLQRIFDEIAGMPILKGVIHAAGLVDDGLLCNQNRERFIGVMAPKTCGSWLLHGLTENRELDFFVMCSGGAALFGSPGQGNYAAANAFMDGLAHYRRSLGLPALSINWGPWAEGGMAATLSQRDHERWASMGMGTIDPVQGLTALEMALTQEAPQIAVLPVNWPVFCRQFETGQEPPFLSEIVRRECVEDQVPSLTGPSEQFLDQLRQAEPEDRYELLMDHVRKVIVAVLGLHPTAIVRQNEGLTDMGMDSLMAVEFSNRLKRTLNRHLPSTLAFEHPTLKGLTDHLATEVLELQITRSPAPAADKENMDEYSVRASVEHMDDESVAELLIQELDNAGY
jgi:acyl transferase domain-containing protein